jgi:hypothetical protein
MGLRGGVFEVRRAEFVPIWAECLLRWGIAGKVRVVNGFAGVFALFEFGGERFHHRVRRGHGDGGGGSASGLCQDATAGRGKPRPYKTQVFAAVVTLAMGRDLHGEKQRAAAGSRRDKGSRSFR